MKKIILVIILLISNNFLYSDTSIGISTKTKHSISDGIINNYYLTDINTQIGYINLGCGILTIPQFTFPFPHNPYILNQFYLYTGLGIDIPIEKFILGFDGNIGISYSDYLDFKTQFLHGEINTSFLLPISNSYNSYFNLDTGISTILVLTPINYFFHIGIGIKVYL